MLFMHIFVSHTHFLQILDLLLIGIVSIELPIIKILKESLSMTVSEVMLGNAMVLDKN